MSIHNQFRPLSGGACRVTQFVQPLMTSNDSWDITQPASCGMVLTGVEAGDGFAKWMAFDGNQSTRWAVWSTGGSMNMVFGLPVRITDMVFSLQAHYTGATYVLSSGGIELGRAGGVQGDIGLFVAYPVFSTTYRINVLCRAPSGIWAYTSNIKINGDVAI